MIYQYPQPWLQTFWQQTMVPPVQGSTRSALSPAMPTGVKKKPGQGVQIDPVRPGMMPTANAFAHPAAVFGGYGGMSVPKMKGY